MPSLPSLWYWVCLSPGSLSSSPTLSHCFLELRECPHWWSRGGPHLQMRTPPVCLVAQLCLTLCDPMNCSPPGSSVHGDSPGKNTGVGCHALLQGIFPTQGSNPGFLHRRQILYRLSHQGSPHPHLSHMKQIFCANNTGLTPAITQLLKQLSHQGDGGSVARECWV